MKSKKYVVNSTTIICASHRCVWECTIKSPKVFYVMTLALDLWPKLRHENGNELGKCLEIQTHFHKYGKIPWMHAIWNTPKWKNSRNYNFLKVLNIWDKSVDSKHGPNWAPMHNLKSFWSVDIESVLTFFIWSCELGVKHGQNYEIQTCSLTKKKSLLMQRMKIFNLIGLQIANVN